MGDLLKGLPLACQLHEGQYDGYNAEEYEDAQTKYLYCGFFNIATGIFSFALMIPYAIRMDILTGLMVMAILGVSIFQVFVFFTYHGQDAWYSDDWTLMRLIYCLNVCSLMLAIVRFSFVMRTIFAVDHTEAFIAAMSKYGEARRES